MCLLLVIATSNQWILKQLDVNNAFRHSDLQEEMYCNLHLGYPFLVPTKFSSSSSFYAALKKLEHKVYKAFFLFQLFSFLISHNYICSLIDHSLFLKHENSNTIVLLVYVDDIVLTNTNEVEINSFTMLLDKQFHKKKS